MTILFWLSLLWVGLLVLALVVYLVATAVYLHGARVHLTGIADDLEKVAAQTVPLDTKLGQIGADVGAIVIHRLKEHARLAALVVAALVIGGVTVYAVKSSRSDHTCGVPDQVVAPQCGSEAAKRDPSVPCPDPGEQNDSDKLPAGTTLLEPSDSIELTGRKLCAHCTWGMFKTCTTALWDEKNHHVVAIQPNEQLSKLEEMCTNRKCTVEAKGSISVYQRVNYMLISSFTVHDPKDDDARSPMGKLVDEAVDAKWGKKDNVTAKRLFEQAEAMIGPNEKAMDRYQIFGGLATIAADAKDYATARKHFARAVEESKLITENLKPLAFSYYNLACAQGLLGDHEAALVSLRAALVAEQKTPRRKYVEMSQKDEAFAKVLHDQRFTALMTEFGATH